MVVTRKTPRNAISIAALKVGKKVKCTHLLDLLTRVIRTRTPHPMATSTSTI